MPRPGLSPVQTPDRLPSRPPCLAFPLPCLYSQGLRPGTAVLTLFFSAAVAVVAAQPRPVPPVSLVLSRAASYVERFADRFAGVVVAEAYTQHVMPALNRFGGPPTNVPQRRGAYSGPLQRSLKSDLLLVRPVGTDAWMQFRDVTEVDGRRLRDRNDRLARLFLEPSTSTAEQARKIMAESARYNIGDIERNINLPVLALAVLSRSMQPGFQFGLGEPVDAAPLPKSGAFTVPADALVLWFRETQTRTMVVSPQGRNLPSSGRFWLDPLTSRVRMTEIGIDDQWLKASIFVAYGEVEGFDLPVPVEMHERFENKLNGTRVEGTATYSNFRQFNVAVDESIAPLKDK